MDEKILYRALDSLGVSGYHLHFGRTKKCGIDAYDFDVHLEEEEHHHDHEHSHDEHNHSHDEHEANHEKRRDPSFGMYAGFSQKTPMPKLRRCPLGSKERRPSCLQNHRD